MDETTTVVDSTTSPRGNDVELDIPPVDGVIILESVLNEGLLGLKKNTWKSGGSC